MLPRVEDLERSPQWTSLTNEIDNLERIRRPWNHRVVVRRPRNTENQEYFSYQRRSMPEVQRATSVWIKPADRSPRESEDQRPTGWAWRPKTEFERSYFFDEFTANSNSCYPEPLTGRVVKYSTTGQSPCADYPQESSRSSHRSHRLGQRCGRCEIDEELGKESPYSGSRERLHEIFERNRYLRRKFFSGEQSQEFPKEPKTKYRTTTGFGSTETLTSQSNQSSISSTNERKSNRGRSNDTPDMVEEEKRFQDYQGTTNSARLTVRTEHGKLLVNIVPSDKVYIARKIDFTDGNGSSSTQTPNQFRSTDDGKHPSNDRDDHRRLIETDVDYGTKWEVNNATGRCSDLTNRSRDKFVSSCNIGHVDYDRIRTESRPVGGFEVDDYRTRSKFQADNSRKTISPRDLYKSLPNLAQLNLKPSSPILLKCSITDLSTNSSSNHRRTGLDRQVESSNGQRVYNSVEGPGQSSNDLERENSCVRRGKIPPPLDLTGINERYEELEASERRYLNNYTEDVTILLNNEFEGLLRLAEDTTVKEKPAGNVLLSEELRSPRLVSSQNSRLEPGVPPRPVEEEDRKCDRQGSIAGGQPGTGSTLASVYGPIPYSQ